MRLVQGRTSDALATALRGRQELWSLLTPEVGPRGGTAGNRAKSFFFKSAGNDYNYLAQSVNYDYWPKSLSFTSVAWSLPHLAKTTAKGLVCGAHTGFFINIQDR